MAASVSLELKRYLCNDLIKKKDKQNFCLTSTNCLSGLFNRAVAMHCGMISSSYSTKNLYRFSTFKEVL